MADLGGAFDVNSVEPRADFGLIPKGEYEAVIIDSQRKATSKGGEMLSLTIQIINGEFQNRRLWENLNLWNKSDQAVEIAKATLSSIGRATGVPTISDSSQLHDKPMRISVAVKHNKDRGEDENRIVGYKPRNAGPAATPAPVAANAVPW